jgi:hypothetical protein
METIMGDNVFIWKKPFYNPTIIEETEEIH